MRVVFRLVVRLACLPADTLASIVVLALIALGQAGPAKRVDGLQVLFLRQGRWAARWWPYATTLGHTVVAHPSFGEPQALPRMARHESTHVRQFEAVCVFWALALSCFWGQGQLPLELAALTPFVWLLFYAAAAFCAVSEGRPAYRENVLEEQAYGSESVRARNRS